MGPLKRAVHSRRVRKMGQLAGLSVTAGVLGTLGAEAFQLALEWVLAGLYGQAHSMAAVASALPVGCRILIPALGGLAAGWVLTWVTAATQPSADYVLACTSSARAGARLNWRGSLARCASSTISVLSGASIGREGAMVQFSALLTSLLMSCCRLSVARHQLFVVCGAAAGMANLYNTPMAAVVFACEVVFKTVAIGRVAPLLLACAVGQLLQDLLAVSSDTAWLPIPQPAGSGGAQAPGLFALASGMGGIAGLLASAMYGVHDAAQRAIRVGRVPAWCSLSAGGLAVGVLASSEPGVWGNGQDMILPWLGSPAWPLSVLAAFLCAKWCATCASVSSGTVGGVITPSLCVGAVLGMLCSQWTAPSAPLLGHADALTLMLLGMGVCLAAFTGAPFMAVVMVLELSGGLSLVLPLGLGVGVAHVSTRYFRLRLNRGIDLVSKNRIDND